MNNLVLLLAALLLANLPWFSERPLFVLAPRSPKPAVWRLLETVQCFAVFLLLALGIEQRANGIISEQDWEFYAVVAVLFLVFASPGFIWTVLYRRVYRRSRRASL